MAVTASEAWLSYCPRAVARRPSWWKNNCLGREPDQISSGCGSVLTKSPLTLPDEVKAERAEEACNLDPSCRESNVENPASVVRQGK
jgi:hypothetical protein